MRTSAPRPRVRQAPSPREAPRSTTQLRCPAGAPAPVTRLACLGGHPGDVYWGPPAAPIALAGALLGPRLRGDFRCGRARRLLSCRRLSPARGGRLLLPINAIGRDGSTFTRGWRARLLGRPASAHPTATPHPAQQAACTPVGYRGPQTFLEKVGILGAGFATCDQGVTNVSAGFPITESRRKGSRMPTFSRNVRRTPEQLAQRPPRRARTNHLGSGPHGCGTVGTVPTVPPGLPNHLGSGPNGWFGPSPPRAGHQPLSPAA